MEKRKKSIVIGITSLLLVTLILLGLTYAYYKTRIAGNSNEKSVSVVSKNLSVKYQNESAEISATGIEPGYSATKTFEVKNTGSETVEYSVMLDNVTNTFTRTEDWTYTISENGTELKSGTLPASTSYILYSESIDAGATKNYTLKINYANSAEDQSEDMGKSLTFRINISDGLGTTLTSAEEGTLLYAINRDNVVSEPLTVPGRRSSVLKYEDRGFTTQTFESNAVYESNNYFVYGTGYTLDETTGLYTLTGVTVSSDIYQNSYSELVGKYIVSHRLKNISAETKEDAKKITSISYSISKVTSATGENISYQYSSNDVYHDTVLSPTEDDYGTSYYYRGNVENNYVNYSGMCWRIVRVQGDGTIKLALADENGECNADTYDADSSTSALINNGTKYAYKSNATGNVTDFLFENSDIPSVLNDWATNQSLDTSKLIEAEWCNDTAKTSKGFGLDANNDVVKDSNLATNGWYDSSNYGALDRLVDVSSANPTLKCNTKGMEGTTGIEAQAQRYKNVLGILSADEVAFAGATSIRRHVEINGGYTLLFENYLQTNAWKSYWTLSPYILDFSDDTTAVWDVSGLGNLYYGLTSGNSFSVRPSIVLAANVTISSGDGTMDNPYVIS